LGRISAKREISPIHLLTGVITEFKIRVEQCRINGDKAKFFGEIETNMGPRTLEVSNLIRENGFWKWYGNQKAR
jgi:hypothetical protein